MVASTAATDCEAPTAVCDPDSQTCVECVQTSDCNAGVCDTEAHQCVECLAETDCEAPTPLCDTEAQVCAECLENTDCPTTQESLCDAGSCSPCQTNQDCAHLTDTPVCDQTTSECVQCTGTDYASCGTNLDDEPLVCDTQTRTCTEEVEHGAGLCDPCVADAQCALGELCVMEVFQDEEQGYRCLWKEGDTEHGAPATCGSGSRPYFEQLENVTSIDGQLGNVCSLRTSSCTARQQFSTTPCGTTAPDNSLCGVAPPADAICVQAAANEHFCTMTCGNDLDCPLGFPCVTNVGVPYCDL